MKKGLIQSFFHFMYLAFRYLGINKTAAYFMKVSILLKSVLAGFTCIYVKQVHLTFFQVGPGLIYSAEVEPHPNSSIFKSDRLPGQRHRHTPRSSTTSGQFRALDGHNTFFMILGVSFIFEHI